MLHTHTGASLRWNRASISSGAQGILSPTLELLRFSRLHSNSCHSVLSAAQISCRLRVGSLSRGFNPNNTETTSKETTSKGNEQGTNKPCSSIYRDTHLKQHYWHVKYTRASHHKCNKDAAGTGAAH